MAKTTITLADVETAKRNFGKLAEKRSLQTKEANKQLAIITDPENLAGGSKVKAIAADMEEIKKLYAQSEAVLDKISKSFTRELDTLAESL